MTYFIRMIIVLGAMMLQTANAYNKFRYGPSTRKNLMEIYHKRKNQTFYCGCDFNQMKYIDHKRCGFSYRKMDHTTYYVQWEHIVPQSVLKTSISKAPLGDLHNLVPSVGKINNMRANYPFGIIEGEQRDFGQCDFEVKGDLVEAKNDIRGDIARTYLYMQKTYGLKLNQEEQRRFNSWHREDPVSTWECQKNQVIKLKQGNGNPFIERDCQ